MARLGGNVWYKKKKYDYNLVEEYAIPPTESKERKERRKERKKERKRGSKREVIYFNSTKNIVGFLNVPKNDI